MQVLCRKTEGNAELHCCVCGQGFVLFWERQPARERAAARREIQETLRRQHRGAHGPDAHPQGCFLVPDLITGQASRSLGMAMPGQVPVWEL